MGRQHHIQVQVPANVANTLMDLVEDYLETDEPTDQERRRLVSAVSIFNQAFRRLDTRLGRIRSMREKKSDD